MKLQMRLFQPQFLHSIMKRLEEWGTFNPFDTHESGTQILWREPYDGNSATCNILNNKLDP